MLGLLHHSTIDQHIVEWQLLEETLVRFYGNPVYHRTGGVIQLNTFGPKSACARWCMNKGLRLDNLGHIVINSNHRNQWSVYDARKLTTTPYDTPTFTIHL